MKGFCKCRESDVSGNTCGLTLFLALLPPPALQLRDSGPDSGLRCRYHPQPAGLNYREGNPIEIPACWLRRNAILVWNFGPEAIACFIL
jgi:hypothetical protein